jgi:hypothetical protein
MIFQRGTGKPMRESYMTFGDRETTRHYDDVPPGRYTIVVNNSNSRRELDYLLRVFYEV